MAEVTSAALDKAAHEPRRWLYAAVLRHPDGRLFDQSVWTLAPHRELALAEPRVEVAGVGEGWIDVSRPV